jgi:stress-induced morphogen
MENSKIEAIIKENLKEAKVTFINEEGCNLRLEITSPVFEGLPILKRHKLVLSFFSESFSSGSLHALSLSLIAPSET